MSRTVTPSRRNFLGTLASAAGALALPGMAIAGQPAKSVVENLPPPIPLTVDIDPDVQEAFRTTLQALRVACVSLEEMHTHADEANDDNNWLMQEDLDELIWAVRIQRRAIMAAGYSVDGP